MKRHLCWIGLLLAACAPAAAAERLQLALRCDSFGSGPSLDCTLRLADAAGRPVRGATVTLAAHMPSMPLAHRVRPARARASAEAGVYQARLELEMPGLWALDIEVAATRRERLLRRLHVEPCAAGRRCRAISRDPC